MIATTKLRAGEPGTLSIEAVAASEAEHEELDALIASDATASLAHEPRVLAAIGRALRLRAHLLLARSAGRLVGALPLVSVRGPFGATDASVATLDSGGTIGSPEVHDALVRAAASRALARGATLELRSPRPVEVAVAGARLSVSREKDTLVCRLPADPDEVARGIDARTRNHLRKALRSGFHAETVLASTPAVQSFYQVYARTMRDLGSPPHALALFVGIAEALGARARVARVLDDGGTPVAAALLLDDRHGRTVLPWAASDRRVDALEPNTLLYHELLAGTAARGRRELDLGRSTRDGPAYKFKLRWGAEPRALHWTTIAAASARRAPGGAEKEGKFRLAVEAWKRLPLPLARVLGPLVVRWLAA